jgi:protein phosphatase 1 regulatory subunit 10
MNTLMPSNFYSPAAPSASGSGPPKPTPQERKQQFINDIKPRLQQSAFTGAQAVATLVDRIADYGAADVDPSMRLEILTKIRDGAGNHYFRAWLENLTAMDITRDWLKSALMAKDDNSQLVDTIMPLLHVSKHSIKRRSGVLMRVILFSNFALQIIDRLPMTVDSLKTSKLGKIVVKVGKDIPSPGELFLPFPRRCHLSKCVCTACLS